MATDGLLSQIAREPNEVRRREVPAKRRAKAWVCEEILRKALAFKVLFIETKDDVYPAIESLFDRLAVILTGPRHLSASPTTGGANNSPLR
jgi:hypothetical protein